MANTYVTNLGIANVRARLLSSVPYLSKKTTKYNFDVSAYNYELIDNSPFAKPLLAEHVIDPAGTFAAYHPSKRKVYIDNVMSDGSSGTTIGTIKWKPLIAPPTGVPKDIVTKGKFDTYTDAPSINGAPKKPDTYLGPAWEDNKIDNISVPDDEASIKGYTDWYATTPAAAAAAAAAASAAAAAADVPVPDEEETTTGPTILIPPKVAIWQKQVRDGLWWAVESDAFLNEENTPFWVNFKMMEAPSSASHETCLIIRLGPNDNQNKYDIYLSFNKRPRIIDYLTSSTDGVPPIQVEWNNDLARMISQKRADQDIEVGIMTIAGRLVITVGNVPLVYSRISRESGDDAGKLLEAKIPKGSIQIFGTNVQTRIIACPMSFAPKAILSIPLPTIIQNNGASNNSDAAAISYKGCDYKGKPASSVAELPSPPSYAKKLFGVDCKKFYGPGGGCSPTGFGFHRMGDINFQKASTSTYAILPSTDFYTMVMEPSSDTQVAGMDIAYGGCPYFFRIKGVQEVIGAGGGGGTDISSYLVSVDETAQAPDYFHVKKNASLTFYNPNNIIGNMVIAKQTGIDITWGWGLLGGTKTFTGIVTNLSKSEIAGKETITLNCEDYMYVLKSIPIINSPFYDGMVAVYAIQDLAERGGMLSFEKDWVNENDYFLPAGYAFSQPKMRFNSNQMLLDCILDMTKRFEAYVYFDQDGKFHINKLPGGLLSVATGGPSGIFSSNPATGVNSTIIEERRVDLSFESTVNVISVFTLDRNTRNAIIYAHDAENQNLLLFTKPFLYNQPAFGELSVAKAWAHDVGLRMFFPILKTTFKTIGSNTIIHPLAFVSVDGHPFRVMSVKRNFNAENNDMNCSYECEWLGGA